MKVNVKKALHFLLLIAFFPHITFSQTQGFDFMRPWANSNQLPTGCYSIDSTIKCYRVSQHKTTHQFTADTQCRLGYGQLPIDMTEYVWTRIWDDVIAVNVSLSNNVIWLGIKVLAYTTSLVDAFGHSVAINNSNFWTNTKIGSAASNDRCGITNTNNRNNWIWSLHSSCINNPPWFYLCEYTIGCNVDDLHLQVQNANFHPCLSPDTIVPHNTTVDILCFDGYELNGESRATCNVNTWTQVPECVQGCPLPQKRRHAKLVTDIRKQNFAKGQEAIFVCEDNHFVEREYARTHFISRCEDSGTWSDNSKDCVPISKFTSVVIEVSSQVNKPVTLNCHMQLTHESKIQWIKNGLEISSADKYHKLPNGSLSIPKLSDNDVGLFFCQTQFQDSTQIASTVYNVISKSECPSSKKNNNKAETVLIEEGNSVTLRCGSGHFDEEVKWFKDDKLMWSTKKQSVLPSGALFFSKVHLEDIGTYTCESKMIQNTSSKCKTFTSHRLVVTASAETVCKTQTEQSVDSVTTQLQKQPWLVTLWRDDEIVPFCYGSIIDNQWMITSAFCLSSFRRKITLGLSVQLGVTQERKRIPVEVIRVHPKYHRRFYDHDIGLAKLHGPPLKFPYDVTPACVPEVNLIGKDTCRRVSTVNGTVGGWGSLDTNIAEDLAFTVEPMVVADDAECHKVGSTRYTNDMFCANGTKQPTYAGDSGSPFVVIWNKKIHIVGIYSWGQRSTSKGPYDYFINISHYHAWIQSIVSSNEKGGSTKKHLETSSRLI